MSSNPSGWATPKKNWSSADIVSSTDLNRVEGNIDALDNGARTLDPAQAPTGNVGTLRQLLDWFANCIKAITGAANWYDSPIITLAGAKHGLDSIQSALNTHKSSGDHDGRYYTKSQLDPILAAASQLVPPGVIVMWSGSIANIPSGWALCDGTNGTPDLRNRFIVGAGSSYAVGAKGGAAEVTLTVDQMPSHRHSVAAQSGTGSGVTGLYYGDGTTSRTVWTSYVGDGKPHENRPPYYALAFIMKL